MSNIHLKSTVDENAFRATVDALVVESFLSIPQPFSNSAAAAFLQQASTCLAISSARSDAAQLSPVELQEHAISFDVGYHLPQADIVSLTQPWNSGPFIQDLCAALQGVPPFSDIDCSDIAISLASSDDEQGAARRRRFVATRLLEVSVAYSMWVDTALCPPGRNHPSCPLVFATAPESRFQQLRAFINSVASSFALRTPSSCVTFEDGIVESCLVSTIYTDMHDMLWPDGARPREVGELLLVVFVQPAGRLPRDRGE